MTGRPELLPQATCRAPRIGIVTQDFAGAPEAEGAEALRIAAKAAERAGATVRTLAMPEIVAEAWRMHPDVQEFEAHQALPGNTARITTRWRRLLRGKARREQGHEARRL